MTSGDRLGGLLLLLFASLVVRESLRLPYWPAIAPGPGFLPFWLGVALAIGAVPLVIGRRAAAAPDDRMSRRDLGRLLGILGFAAGTAALVPVTGMVLATGLFTLATLSLLAPQRRGGNALAAVLAPAIVWLVFVHWLNVPLPRGLPGF